MPLVLDGTNGVSGVDGTASNPAIEGTDSNTGIFYPAADTVAIGTGGTERLRVDSAGNAGLGVTPSAWSLIKAMQIAGNAMIGGYNFNTYIGNNWVYDGADKYIGTGYATKYLQNSGAHIWQTAPSGTAGNAITFTQAMTLDASGNLGVGTTNPLFKLVVSKAGAEGIEFVPGGTSNVSTTQYYNRSGAAYTANVQDASYHSWLISGAERARITSAGEFLVGKTAAALGTAGFQTESDGGTAITRSGSIVLYVNRLTNDGTLVSLQQATVEEGTISVSGTTVSYNGGHLARWSQLISGQRDESIVKGTVLSNLDEMCEWLDAEGNPLPNEQLNRMKVSDVEGDTNVAGVFVNWDNDDQDNPYDMNIAMTGDMIIRIAQGVTVQKGDLLMSAGDGTAKPQGDDIVRSKTVAKVTSNHVTCTYEDGSYCVPCVLMAC